MPAEVNSAGSAASASGFLLDSITKLVDEHRSAVVVAGSHGGLYAGYCAAKGGVRAVILNDAGIGKDRAGIGALDYLDRAGVAGATVASMSCRICDGADAWANGIISYVNQAAKALGCAPGQSTQECAFLLRQAVPSQQPAPAIHETRTVFHEAGDGFKIIGIDSASLIAPDDEGHFVIAGSHGGVPSGDPSKLNPISPRVMTFNDAGGGKDGSGYARLAALNDRGVASMTVAADSARIGDARSCYHDGVISRINPVAAAMGATIGMPLQVFVERRLQERRKSKA